MGIEAGALAGLQGLQVLDLSNNQLPGIPSSALRGVAGALVQLLMSGNRIHSLTVDALEGLGSLKHLDLSGNSITHISHGAFSTLGAMEVFKVHRNSLKALPEGAFDAFSQVSQVLLYDNRWECDCHLAWLWQWMNVTDPSVWDTPGYPLLCDGPALHSGSPLASLPLPQLACEVQMKSSDALVQVGGSLPVWPIYFLFESLNEK